MSFQSRLVLIVAFLAAACGSQATTAEGIPGTTISIATENAAAVLLLDENLNFARTEVFTNGPDVYRDEVEGLARLLGERGISARVMSEDGLTIEKLAAFRAVYIVDAFVVMPEVQDLLEEYVRGGGVLVGVCEVGRHPGSWDKDWKFGRVFGLKLKPVDPWGTGTTWHESIYRVMDRVEKTSPILEGLGDRIDLGAATQAAMAVELLGAKAAATYPRHVAHRSETEAAAVEEPLPALTVHGQGKGFAIFLAALPTGRKKEGWKGSLDAGSLLANAMRYASNTITLEKKSLSSTIIIGRNQLGYEPDWPKEIVARGIPGGSFRLSDEKGATVLEGFLRPWPTTLWRDSFAVADISSVNKEGSYGLEISAGEEKMSVKIRIAHSVLEQELLPSQAAFMKSMRCGDTCHVKDPVRGGHHDATGDWAVRMWSMPHVVYGLTRHMEKRQADSAMRSELEWAIEWCLKMQTQDGGVHASVRPPGDHSGGGSPLAIRPWQDEMQRELETRYSYNYTVTYAAGMARAARALKNDRAGKAAERAWARLRRDPVSSTSDIGNRLWAAVELYNLNGDKALLADARLDAAEILRRQLDPGHVRGADVSGNFFADASRTTFSPQQWKVYHSIGIYLGLIELSRVLPAGDSLGKEIEGALNRFTNGYLLAMSSITPYGQMAVGLEPGATGKFDIYCFSHQGAWVRNHGLNCDMLVMALVALERDRDKPDPRLRPLAIRQINWLLGANPLGFSMVDGLGETISPMIDHTQGTGRFLGGIANGIIGRGKENVPAWGASWDSREYWLPHNVYLLAAASML